MARSFELPERSSSSLGATLGSDAKMAPEILEVPANSEKPKSREDPPHKHPCETIGDLAPYHDKDRTLEVPRIGGNLVKATVSTVR